MKKENKYGLLLQKVPMLMVNSYERNVLNGQPLKQLVDRYGKAQDSSVAAPIGSLLMLLGVVIGGLACLILPHFWKEASLWIQYGVLSLPVTFGIMACIWLLLNDYRANKEINLCEPPLIEFEASARHLNPYCITDAVGLGAVQIKWRAVEVAKNQLEAEDNFKDSRLRETDNVDAVIASGQQLKKAQSVLDNMWESIREFEAITDTRREIFDMARARMNITRH